jgi:hypothetical protein
MFSANRWAFWVIDFHRPRRVHFMQELNTTVCVRRNTLGDGQ